jgi:tripartite-type tricarboxylate transporter receptor subunit TctC
MRRREFIAGLGSAATAWPLAARAQHVGHRRRGYLMSLPRRRFLHLVSGAVVLPAVSRIATAQTYPTRPVRLIVGFPPGGGHDITARLITLWLSERLGQQFIIENRAGANGNIGAQAAANASPDGYTLLFIGGPQAINVGLYGKLAVDLVRDIAPVAVMTRSANAMCVNPKVPARTVPEFIAYAKANPGKLNMASGGNGNPEHVAGELFKMMAGVSLLHVPYRGTAPALTDTIAGQTQVHFAALAAALEQVRAGKLRALAVTTATRLAILPGVPAVGEFLPGYEASPFNGIAAPRNTPTEIITSSTRRSMRASPIPRLRDGLPIWEGC